MITDIFARRYQTAFWFPEAAADGLQPIFMQATHLIFNDLENALAPSDAFYKGVHDDLARELGLPGLPVDGHNYYQRCASFLGQPHNLWNDYHDDVDTHTKRRFSILEMLFAAFEEYSKASADVEPTRPSRGIFGRSAAQNPSPEIVAQRRQAFTQAAVELNQRLRIGRAGLVYHNGVLQRSTDELTEERIVAPFWELVAYRGWSAVDSDMKEACDRADRLEPEAANYAMRALESAIKLVSDNAGASGGKERGAANYVDNLLSERAGRLLRGWEGEAIKALFRDVRNPMSHGGGAVTPQPLTVAQTTWVIEVCMSWIKRLSCTL